MKRLFSILLILQFPLLYLLLPCGEVGRGLSSAFAQVGEQRSVFSIGGSAGYVLSNVDFVPKVTKGYHGGTTFGFSMRYTSEKYFSTICSIAAEVNFAQIGWKEKILNSKDEQIMLAGTTTPMAYQRNINYIQVPIMAHLAWGRERKGVNAFINLGPQFGAKLSESTDANFNIHKKEAYQLEDRASTTVAQDTMAIKNTFDYGIVAGAGIEYVHPKIGHFILEGRYYYGLGNIYGDTKKDYFGRSNFSNIVIKASYLIDL